MDGAVLTASSVAGVIVGVLLSVVLPVLRGYIRREFVATASTVPPWVKKYSALAAFAIATAIIVLAIYDSTNPEGALRFLPAVLLGFGWEASIEKFMRPPVS